MKATLFLFILLSVNILFSQEINARLSDALPLPSSPYAVKNESFFHNGKLYFFNSDGSYRESSVVVNTENNQVSSFEQKKLTIDNFAVSLTSNKKHISDEHLYEFTYCVNRKKLTNVSGAILKRNLNSISEVEKVLWLENFNVTSIGAFSHYSFFPGKSCFYIVRKSAVGNEGENNYIAKYNYDLEEVWRKDFSFTNEKGIDVDYITVNENDDLLICLKLKGEIKGRWSFKTSAVTVNRSGLFFYLLTKEGEELGISPQIDQNILTQKYDLQYYPEQKQVVGLFLVNKLKEKDYTTYGNGYVYMKWDSEGEILTSHSHYFSIDELKNPETDEYLAVNKKDYSSFLNKDGEMHSLRIDNSNPIYFTSNQEAVIGYGSGNNLLYKVNRKGQLDWSYFIPTGGAYMVDRLIVVDDVIYFCQTDYAENFTTGQYKAASKLKTLILSVRKIDEKTGELIAIKPIMNVPSDDYTVYNKKLLIDKEKPLFVVEYWNTKKKRRKYVSYTF